MKYTNMPEIWGIIITEENVSILNEWRTHKGALGKNNIGEWIFSKGYFKKLPLVRGYWEPNNSENVPEITFEEFQKYVLKQKQEINYEIF